MGWMLFVAGAVLSWGAYGVLLYLGQIQLGNPLKALLCVGVAYFLIGVILPVASLSAQGGLSNFNSTGLISWIPSAGQVGSNSVTVRVTDSTGLFGCFFDEFSEFEWPCASSIWD